MRGVRLALRPRPVTQKNAATLDYQHLLGPMCPSAQPSLDRQGLFKSMMSTRSTSGSENS